MDAGLAERAKVIPVRRHGRPEDIAAAVAHLASEDTGYIDGGGVRAVDANGKDLGGHQAFWFAWSQFHPATKLWPF